MNWTRWLREGRLERHRARTEDLVALLSAAERSLDDAQLAGLSPEGAFQLAYSAALDLAMAVVLSAGHPPRSRAGHHHICFEAAGLALGNEAAAWTEYLGHCRRRRHVVHYMGGGVSPAEAQELLRGAREYERLVLQWFERHPWFS